MQITAQIDKKKALDVVTFLRSMENTPEGLRSHAEILNERREFFTLDELKASDHPGEYSIKLTMIDVKERTGDRWQNHRISSVVLHKFMELLS